MKPRNAPVANATAPPSDERAREENLPSRVEFFVPIATKSVLNLREHWAVRAKRVKRERTATHLVMNQARHMPLALALAPCLRVDLVRVSPRGLDSDNLAGALKGVRDQIADELGMDDGDPALEWRYSQEKGKPPGVRVTVEARR